MAVLAGFVVMVAAVAAHGRATLAAQDLRVDAGRFMTAGGSCTAAAVLGEDLPPLARKRLLQTLQSQGVRFVSSTQAADKAVAAAKAMGCPAVLACGASPLVYSIVTPSWLKPLQPEGYAIRRVKVDGIPVLATVGIGPSTPAYARGRGSVYGCYAALQQLGSTFFNPFDPNLRLDFVLAAETDDVSSSPHWAYRGTHVHTQHPLELTNLLTGWDQQGPDGKVTEPWEVLRKDWEPFLEWCLAHGLNQIEWLPLWAKSWETFATSTERAQRMRNLTDTARGFGIRVGADAAIALRQQHAFALIAPSAQTNEQVTASIHANMKWLNDSGFEFISSERQAVILHNFWSAACPAIGKHLALTHQPPPTVGLVSLQSRLAAKCCPG
eukprot:m.291968 g.291968  ORF g.291968 m.291968 type:complete len:382 (-) comp19481_c0_seq2:1494-2639(-)